MSVPWKSKLYLYVCFFRSISCLSLLHSDFCAYSLLTSLTNIVNRWLMTKSSDFFFLAFSFHHLFTEFNMVEMPLLFWNSLCALASWSHTHLVFLHLLYYISDCFFLVWFIFPLFSSCPWMLGVCRVLSLAVFSFHKLSMVYLILSIAFSEQTYD